MIEYLRELCAIPGVSGHEDAVRDYIIGQLHGAHHRIDALGNLIVEKKGGNSPKRRVLLDAHMDEVGFIVTGVTSEGYLKFEPVGGVDAMVVAGKRLRIGEIPGVVAVKAVHRLSDEERAAALKFDDLYIDIGAANQDDALQCVQVGDTAIFDSGFSEFGDGYMRGRALDNRAGCAALLDILAEPQPYDLTCVFSVQEEVGLRGAGAAAYGIKPDAAIVVDSTTAADVPGVEGAKRVCALGAGPVVSFMDNATLYDRDLYRRALALGERLSIQLQTKSLVAGGNNAGAVHKSWIGVPTLSVSAPCRYLHSPACVMLARDLVDTARFVSAMAAELAGGAE